eukprot:2575996-Rhodomonas_salina.4
MPVRIVGRQLVSTNDDHDVSELSSEGRLQRRRGSSPSRQGASACPPSPSLPPRHAARQRRNGSAGLTESAHAHRSRPYPSAHPRRAPSPAPVSSGVRGVGSREEEGGD